MEKTLPKGHVSCLSKSFHYTPAASTNVAATFARIKRELTLRAASSLGSPMTGQPAVSRIFPRATIEAARRVLRAGGLRLVPDLVRS